MCELCGQDYDDILQHLSITHGIHDLDQYNQEVLKVQERKSDKTSFNAYVKELQERKAKGEISAKDYRELIEKWKK
jgi:uncharacterized membrane protein